MRRGVVEINADSDKLIAVERTQGPASRYAIECQSEDHAANLPDSSNNFIVADMYLLTYVNQHNHTRAIYLEACEHCLPEEARALFVLQNLDQPGAVS